MVRSHPVQVSSPRYWNPPPEGTFKLNIDGAAKGNPVPAGYGGVIRNSEGTILSLFWGSIGSITNNMAELEGLINGLIWARQTRKMPLMVEGDSQIIINTARKIQEGTLTSQISKNW